MNLIKSDGSQQRTITDKNYPHEMQWNPDGSKIVFINSQGSTTIVNTDGTELSVLDEKTMPASFHSGLRTVAISFTTDIKC